MPAPGRGVSGKECTLGQGGFSQELVTVSLCRAPPSQVSAFCHLLSWLSPSWQPSAAHPLARSLPCEEEHHKEK